MEELAQTWRALPPEQKVEMARALDTSVAYLSQLAHGHRRPGKAMRRILVEYLKTRPAAQ
jgi:hypothetical protein